MVTDAEFDELRTRLAAVERERDEARAREGAAVSENARLVHDLHAKNRDLAEALERETALGEILRVIAHSPTDVSIVLNTIAERAARLCGASDAFIRLVEGDVLLPWAAHFGTMTPTANDQAIRTNRSGQSGRALLERRTLQAHEADPDIATEFPETWQRMHAAGVRVGLAVPLHSTTAPLGTIVMRRIEPLRFTEAQIALVQTFADQAAIAIENTRLFEEVQNRTHELEERNTALTEALEHQRATAEVLGLISRAPVQLQPVIDGFVEPAATRLGAEGAGVQLVEREHLRLAAVHHPTGVHIGDTMPVDRLRVSGVAAGTC